MRDEDDFYGYGGFKPYVSVGVRRAQAAREIHRLKKEGRTLAPVAIEGRKVAKTFWGEAWCDNLQHYSDFANRLPRGRSYARNGSVLDLQIEPGRVAALVRGSALYDVTVTVGPVAPTRWRAICNDCSGAIDSLIELLQGRFSDSVMTRLCDPKTGLFPSPKEIVFTCSCPDWAYLCKHVAAVLYGIGARLDHHPELLFTLRKVDHQELIADSGASLAQSGRVAAKTKVLAEDDLSAMFGIDVAPPTASKKAPPAPHQAKPVTAVRPAPGARKKAVRAAASSASPPKGRQRPLSAKKRLAISERMRAYWAERRRQKEEAQGGAARTR